MWIKIKFNAGQRPNFLSCQQEKKLENDKTFNIMI
jgi:hypothetical protein